MTSLRGWALIVSMAVALGACGYDPPISDEAKAREAVVMELVERAVVIPGADLRRETSTPGRPSGGSPSRLGEDVQAGRLYKLELGALPSCDELVEQLRAAGWVTPDCDGVSRTGDDFTVPFESRCQGFSAYGTASVRTESHNDLFENSVEVEVHTPYPGEATSNLGSVAEGNACDVLTD